MKVIFPTNEKFSYISDTGATINNANYFTVLEVDGQNIKNVEILNNDYNQEELVENFKNNIMVLPFENEKNINELKESGIIIYKNENNKKVLDTYNDFLQDKLVRF